MERNEEQMDLTKELQDHFAQETKWRPGLGIWIGSQVQQLHTIEVKIENGRRRLSDLEGRMTMVELKNLEDRVALLEKRLKLTERLEACIAKMEENERQAYEAEKPKMTPKKKDKGQETDS